MNWSHWQGQLPVDRGPAVSSPWRLCVLFTYPQPPWLLSHAAALWDPTDFAPASLPPLPSCPLHSSAVNLNIVSSKKSSLVSPSKVAFSWHFPGSPVVKAPRFHLRGHRRVCFLVGGFPGGSGVKNLPASAEDTADVGSIPELGSSPRGGNGNPFQYSCVKNPMDRGAWRVRRVTKVRYD